MIKKKCTYCTKVLHVHLPPIMLRFFLTDGSIFFPRSKYLGGRPRPTVVPPCWYYGVAEPKLSGPLFLHEGGFPDLVAIGDPPLPTGNQAAAKPPGGGDSCALDEE